MSRRKHYASSGKALPWVVVSVLAVAAIAVGGFVLFRGGGDGPSEDLPPADLTWEVGFIKTVAVDEKPAQSEIDAAGEEISLVLDDLYTAGFVDPMQWGNGSFPSLTEHFSADAGAQAMKDLDDLSLGSLAPRVDRVDPGKSRLFVSLLVDGDGQITVADVDATFRATARTKGGEPFKIFHKGRYYLEPADGSWTIVGYRVSGEMNKDAGENEPEPGPSAGATP